MEVTSPAYWRERLAKCGGDLHRAMFEGNHDQLSEYNERHRRQLAAHVHPHTSILDVGCGYGRVLTLLPSSWQGRYHGIDISPEFISIARMMHPSKSFEVADARTFSCDERFSLAIVVWTRDMLLREHASVWNAIEENLAWFADRVLVVE